MRYEKLTGALFDPNGPLLLTHDFFFFIASLILLTIAIPSLTSFIMARRDEARWRPLREHLGIVISYWHGRLGEKICDGVIPHSPVETSKENHTKRDENPLDGVLIPLQTELSAYGFCMNADIAKAVGDYWSKVTLLWYKVEYELHCDQSYCNYIIEEVSSGKKNPFEESEGHLITKIHGAYGQLMELLNTRWYYQRSWTSKILEKAEHS